MKIEGDYLSPSERPLGRLMATRRQGHRHASPVSVQEGFPAGDGDIAGQHLEGGGLAGTVDSQQPETLSDTTGGVG